MRCTSPTILIELTASIRSHYPYKCIGCHRAREPLHFDVVRHGSSLGMICDIASSIDTMHNPCPDTTKSTSLVSQRCYSGDGRDADVAAQQRVERTSFANALVSLY